MSNTLAETLREFADAFETGTRTSTGETFYKLKDDAPPWIKGDSGYDAMHAIHCAVDDEESPRLPDDWIYENAASIADALADAAKIWPEEIPDSVAEIADGHVDVYHGERTAWLASHIYNASLVDDACETYDPRGKMDTFSRIGLGQYLALERIAYAILELGEARAEELDDEDAATAADEEE